MQLFWKRILVLQLLELPAAFYLFYRRFDEFYGPWDSRYHQSFTPLQILVQALQEPLVLTSFGDVLLQLLVKLVALLRVLVDLLHALLGFLSHEEILNIVYLESVLQGNTPS